MWAVCYYAKGESSLTISGVLFYFLSGTYVRICSQGCYPLYKPYCSEQQVFISNTKNVFHVCLVHLLSGLVDPTVLETFERFSRLPMPFDRLLLQHIAGLHSLKAPKLYDKWSYSVMYDAMTISTIQVTFIQLWSYSFKRKPIS